MASCDEPREERARKMMVSRKFRKNTMKSWSYSEKT
jgi:hypothetical protein